jgi:hypothetical protein
MIQNGNRYTCRGFEIDLIPHDKNADIDFSWLSCMYKISGITKTSANIPDAGTKQLTITNDNVRSHCRSHIFSETSIALYREYLNEKMWK